MLHQLPSLLRVFVEHYSGVWQRCWLQEARLHFCPCHEVDDRWWDSCLGLTPLSLLEPGSSTDIAEDLAWAGSVIGPGGSSQSQAGCCSEAWPFPIAKNEFKSFRPGQAVLPWSSRCMFHRTRLSCRNLVSREAGQCRHTCTHTRTHIHKRLAPLEPTEAIARGLPWHSGQRARAGAEERSCL